MQMYAKTIDDEIIFQFSTKKVLKYIRKAFFGSSCIASFH